MGHQNRVQLLVRSPLRKRFGAFADVLRERIEACLGHQNYFAFQHYVDLGSSMNITTVLRVSERILFTAQPFLKFDVRKMSNVFYGRRNFAALN